tara:strand:+ start:2964 stop:3140 length:177 start_codon:yes stop_codon:yes gene_type:complete
MKDFNPQNLGLTRIVEVHGRPVKQIDIMDSRLMGHDKPVYLMIEVDGRTWLWDGMVDP